jgi:hypothetical protein
MIHSIVAPLQIRGCGLGLRLTRAKEPGNPLRSQRTEGRKVDADDSGIELYS